MGCWAIGGPFWSGAEALGWSLVDDRESIEAIHCALDLGVNLFDTADVYGAGHSERVLGKALKGKRNQAVIATKFGQTFDENTRQVTGSDASAAYIRRACEDSLRRLNTDYIDLYQFHLNDYPAGQAQDIMQTLERLVDDGKIRYYGWSTDFPDRAKVFEKGAHCTAIQFQENVLDDNAELVALCRQQQLAGLNRGPLAMGLLTGKYNEQSRFEADDVRGENSPAWMKYFKNGDVTPEWLDKVTAIRELLTRGGRSLVQGSLAWLWARSEITIPIPGFKTKDQVEENSKAMEYGPMPVEQFRSINRILERQT
jgi:aryl-alcohol dehydrogenase-like predicted oxidoreductase